MFPVVSQSGSGFGLECLLFFFFSCLIGCTTEIVHPKNWADELNLAIPANESFKNVQNVRKCSEMPAFFDGER